MAQDLAKALGAGLVEIVDKRKRRGLRGWLTGGGDAVRKNSTKIGPIFYKPGGK